MSSFHLMEIMPSRKYFWLHSMGSKMIWDERTSLLLVDVGSVGFQYEDTLRSGVYHVKRIGVVTPSSLILRNGIQAVFSFGSCSNSQAVKTFACGANWTHQQFVCLSLMVALTIHVSVSSHVIMRLSFLSRWPAWSPIIPWRMSLVTGWQTPPGDNVMTRDALGMTGSQPPGFRTPMVAVRVKLIDTPSLPPSSHHILGVIFILQVAAVITTTYKFSPACHQCKSLHILIVSVVHAAKSSYPWYGDLISTW